MIDMSRKWTVMLSMCVAMLSLVVGAASAVAAGSPEIVAESGGIAGTAFTVTGGTSKLETIAGNVISCTGNQSSGTISSATMINAIVVKFTGCKTMIGGFKAPCKSSGAAAEEVVTNSLTGELSYLLPNSPRTALDLKPTASGGDFATFTCALGGLSSTLTVEGSLIAELTPVNAAFGTAFTLDLNQTGGMQAFRTTLNPKTCEPSTDVLFTEATGLVSFPTEESGVEGNEALTTSKKIKIVATKC
jgi:hypothetical protein